MNGSRLSRRALSSCNETSNIFNGKSMNSALAQLIPHSIFKEIAPKSHLTCSTILNFKEFMPSDNFDEEFQTMQLASNLQTNEPYETESYMEQKIPTVVTKNSGVGQEMKEEQIWSYGGGRIENMLMERDFLQALNDFVFSKSHQKSPILSTRDKFQY